MLLHGHALGRRTAGSHVGDDCSKVFWAQAEFQDSEAHDDVPRAGRRIAAQIIRSATSVGRLPTGPSAPSQCRTSG